MTDRPIFGVEQPSPADQNRQLAELLMVVPPAPNARTIPLQEQIAFIEQYMPGMVVQLFQCPPEQLPDMVRSILPFCSQVARSRSPELRDLMGDLSVLLRDSPTTDAFREYCGYYVSNKYVAGVDEGTSVYESFDWLLQANDPEPGGVFNGTRAPFVERAAYVMLEQELAQMRPLQKVTQLRASPDREINHNDVRRILNAGTEYYTPQLNRLQRTWPIEYWSRHRRPLQMHHA
jgi:hypothetical protein